MLDRSFGVSLAAVLIPSARELYGALGWMGLVRAAKFLDGLRQREKTERGDSHLYNFLSL